MKILHLQPELNITSGITKSIYQITKNIKRYQNFIGCFGGDTLEKFISEGYVILLLEKKKFILFRTVSNFISIYKFCKKNKIDLIHSHHRYFDLLCFFLSHLIKIKTITTVHSKLNNYRNLSYKADHFIAVSETIKKVLINNFRVAEDKISMINNFVIEEELGNSIVENFKEHSSIQIKNIVFIGRLSKEKGIDILLKAFNKVFEKNSKVCLILVGNGEEEGFVKSYINKNNIKIFLEKPTLNIRKYYVLADVIVLPSRVDPFPMVMLEAGIMKKAFIGTDVDGISEVIENNKNGLLVKPGNIDDLAAAITLLISNEEKTKELGENLYRKIISKFTPEIIIPQYETLYNRLIYGSK